MEKCEFKRGDRILVRDDSEHGWAEREFLTYIEGVNMPYVARGGMDPKTPVMWKYAKAIPEKTETGRKSGDLLLEYLNLDKPLWKVFVEEEVEDIRKAVAGIGVYGILSKFEEWLKNGRYIVDREPE